MKEKAKEYLQNAVDKLKDANNELYRPEEDVVSFSVCKNAQFAIDNYLRGYLYKNNVDASSFKTINELYEQCKKINEKFVRIDLSTFDCASSEIDSKYCNEVSRVSHCYNTADMLDSLLREERIIG